MGSMEQQVTDAQDCIRGHSVTAPRAPARERTPIPSRERAPGTDARLLAILTRTIEQDVIPRLLQARRQDKLLAAPRRAALAPVARTVTAAQVGELAALVLAREEAQSIAYIEAMHSGGLAAETLYLDLLAPTARRLGQMWVDDDCDFTDVTVGLFLLQNALRDLGAAFPVDAIPDADASRVLLVPLPGEQHTFGLSMVFDFFRRAGWNAWSGPVESEAELTTMLRNSWFDVVGFSLVCDQQLEDARRVIRLARRVSLNPAVAVMAGGPTFADNPALAALIGADGTAADGREAVRQATALVALSATRPRS